MKYFGSVKKIADHLFREYVVQLDFACNVAAHIMSLPYKGMNSEVFTYEEKIIKWLSIAHDINLNPLSFEREIKLRCALPDKELSPVSFCIKSQIELRQSLGDSQYLKKMVHNHAVLMLQDRGSVKESLKLYADFYREVFKEEARQYIAILVYSVMKPESLFIEGSKQERKALLKLSTERICIYPFKDHHANLIGNILYPQDKEMQIDLAYSVAEFIRQRFYPDDAQRQEFINNQDVMDWAAVAKIDSADFLRKNFNVAPIKTSAPVNAAASNESQESALNILSELLEGYPDEEAGNLPLSSELTGVASSDAGANVYEGGGSGIFE